MRCTRCLTESHAEAKFCSECGTPLRVVPRRCPHCGEDNSPYHQHCGTCGRLLRQDDPATPPAARGERKIVTVLFVDISGFTSLGEHLDPEELRDVTDGWFQVMRDVLHRRGGLIDKYIGDAVMALFGAPVAHEDDAERAIDAALDMHAALARYNTTVGPKIGQPLAIRIGINTGRVFAGYVGRDADRSYTVMGDAVNVAARLESACPIGSVLVSQATYRHVHGVYDVRLVGPLHVKGKTEPIPAFEVLGRRARSLRLGSLGPEHLEIELVGRHQELALLCERSEQVLARRQPHLLVIAGEAGVGKTRLAREFALWLDAKHPEAVLLRARCRPDGERWPFAVLADALQVFADVPPGETGQAAQALVERAIRVSFADRRKKAREPAWAAQEEVDEVVSLLCFATGLTEEAPAQVADARQLFQRTVQAAQRWMRALARRGSVAFLIEDLHWAPELTVEFLEQLLHADDLPLVVLGTLRPELTRRVVRWGQGLGRERMNLLPLAPAYARQFAEALLARLVPPCERLVELVAARDGNPFFMEETVGALLDGGVLTEDPNTSLWSLTCDAPLDLLPVPDTVGKIIQARIDRLSPKGKLAIQRAAVAGQRFSPAALAAIALYSPDDASVTLRGYDAEVLPQMECDLAELVYLGLLVETGERGPDGSVIYQFRHSLTREILYDTVVASLRRAWHQALALFSFRTARGSEPDRATLEQVAYHLGRCDDHARAATVLERAGDAARAVWANRDARARYAEAQAALVRCRAAPAELCRVLESLADVAELDGDYAAAVQAYGEALALVGAEALTGARLLVKRGRSLDHMREREEARAAYDEALRRLGSGSGAEPAGWGRLRASALQNLGWSHYLAGDLAEAARLYRLGLEACEGQDAQVERAALESALGSLARARGDSAGSVLAHRRALALRQAAGDRRGEATSHLNLGTALFSAGDSEGARQVLAQALALHESMGNAEGIGIACLNLGAVHLECGELQAAGAHLARALSVARRTDGWYVSECLRYLAEAALAGGDPARARALVQEGLAVVDGGARYVRGNLLLVAGEIDAQSHDFDAAERTFADALATLESADAGFELAIGLYRYARVLGSAGRRSRAAETLAKARDLFQSVGNMTYLGRAERALAELREGPAVE